MARARYLNGVVPDNYYCGECLARDCKLWRPYQTNHIQLYCADCAAADQGKNITAMGDDGKFVDSGTDGKDANGNTIITLEKTDTIGWLVPAVPTEDGTGYWGYTAIPEKGVKWWRRLPSHRSFDHPVLNLFACIKDDGF